MSIADLDLPFLSSWVQLVVVMVLFAAAIPSFRSRIKDQTISDLQTSLAACRDAALTAEREAKAAHAVAEACRAEVREWRVKYEVQSKFIAPNAVEHFERVMAEHSARVAERHEAMLAQMENQTELVTRSTAVIAAIATKLGLDPADGV